MHACFIISFGVGHITKILIDPNTFGLFLLQWPSGSMNGYAYYHRVDQVNGGDMNHTHTTGFSKKEGFWYVSSCLV